MYLPYQLQSTEYARHLEEIEAKCERRQVIRTAEQPPAASLRTLGDKVHARLRRRPGPRTVGRAAEVRTRTS